MTDDSHNPAPDWLRARLGHVLWTEDEFVEVLTGGPRQSRRKRSALPPEQFNEEARQREAVERHVSDGIQSGELRVEPRLADRRVLEPIRRHVQDAAMLREIERAVEGVRFYEPRKMRVSVAVAWALARRHLFPMSPLSDGHLESVRTLGGGGRATADSKPGGTVVPQADLGKRAAWLREELGRLGISVSELHKKRSGPDPSTTRKVLAGQHVGEVVLERLARALGKGRSDIP